MTMTTGITNTTIPADHGSGAAELCFIERDTAAFDPSSPYYTAHSVAWALTIFFSTIATFQSGRLIFRHLRAYRSPDLQRHCIRLLLLVPIFSLISCIGFRFIWRSSYFAVVRDAYEAVVLWSFHSLMSLHLGPDEQAQRTRLSAQPDRPWPFPFGCLTYNPRGRGFLVNSRMLLLQYPVASFITTTLALALNAAGLFCEESFSPTRGRFWFSLINFASSTMALYALLVFYIVTHELLAKHNPLYKFLSLKFVIFLAFWQSLLLSVMTQWGWIQGWGYSRPANLEKSIQSFLICLEMVIAAMLHEKAFPVEEYAPPGPPTAILRSLLDVLNPWDIVKEVGTAPATIRDLAQYRAAKRAYREIKEIDEAFDDVSIGRAPGTHGSFDGLTGSAWEIEEVKMEK